MNTNTSPTPFAKIMVCDDETHIRSIIASKLRTVGFNVFEARNGQEGLALVSPSAADPLRPDLVITDFQMPMITGLEMCQALRTMTATAKVPVLMLTARGYILTDEELAGTNIRQVISKPFGVRQLLDRVVRLLTEETTAGIPPAALAATTAQSQNQGPLAA